MTTTMAVDVMRLARMGLGHEDIVVKLGISDLRDRAEVRAFVLRMPRCAKRSA